MILLGEVTFGGASRVYGQELEKVPAGEPQAIETIVSRALAELRRYYAPGAPLVRRDAHSKAHGCVKATFQVEPDLPTDLRVGFLSVPGKEYWAWLRFSNGAFKPGSDTGMDGRGMALKLMEPEFSGDAVSAPPRSHDILMINYPVFFSPDAIDYAEFAKAGALTGDSDGLKKFFIPTYFNPFGWRMRQGLIAFRIANQPISSPLAVRYFSMVPYLFGPGRAIKYSARPCQSPLAEPTDSTALEAPDFLRGAMKAELARGPACFELRVQERKGNMPVEDATVEWEESESAFRRVGVITIPPQQFDTPQRDAFCEQTAFNPWNALPAHRPLGSINRVRKALYEAISRERHDRNTASLPDPFKAWNEP
jgi:hypothetical protein